MQGDGYQLVYRARGLSIGLSGLSIGLSSGEMVDGFSRKGCLGAGGSFGFSRIEILGCFSCKWESDNGEGVVRSRENAAQSQWVDRAPYMFQ